MSSNYSLTLAYACNHILATGRHAGSEVEASTERMALGCTGWRMLTAEFAPVLVTRSRRLCEKWCPIRSDLCRLGNYLLKKRDPAEGAALQSSCFQWCIDIIRPEARQILSEILHTQTTRIKQVHKNWHIIFREIRDNVGFICICTTSG